MKNKTVYVLGAGFSMAAGAPSQIEIVKAIYDLKKNKEKPSKKDKILEWIGTFDSFLVHQLRVSEGEKEWYSLEDIYTPIDRSISDNSSFRDYDTNELVRLRATINKLVILAIRSRVQQANKDKSYIKNFAKKLIELGKRRLDNEKNDSVSVITTNWDIMLDNIANSIMKKDKPLPNADFLGVIDYCCHISSLDEDDHKIKPGLYAIGKGGYNLKILKLHGSLNWMQCPKCQRLYVKYYFNFAGGYVFARKYCRHCIKNFGEKNKSNQLDINLIMPTFLKNLSNIQNKLIWQNAGIELSEASKVVFLGYSLPQADFEFKQLLARMIPDDAKIEVVLIETDNPAKKSDSEKYQTAGYRFENFFSGRQLTISYKGVKTYVEKLVRDNNS